MLTRTERQKRNVDIAQALAAPAADVAAISQTHNLSKAQTYRAASQGRELLAYSNATLINQPQGSTGRAASQVNVYSELGRSGLRRFGGLIDDDYDKTFKTLTRRIALYREMGDDAIVAAVLHAVKMTIKRVSWYTQTDGETDADKQASDWLETCMHDMSQSWTDAIDQALGMIQYGFYPAEIVYKKRAGPRKLSLPSEARQGAPSPSAGSKYDDGHIGWRKWVFMAPETLAPGDEWVFDETGGLQGLNQMAPPLYRKVFLPIQKVILFRTTSERGNPESRALLRPMYWSWYLAHNLEEIEAISAERHGAGFPVAYLGSDTSRADVAGSDLQAFQSIVANIKVDEQAGVVIPYAKMGGGAQPGEGALIELVSPPGRGPIDLNQVITRHQQSLAMVGLAQFIHLGMHGTGARAQNQSSQDFFTLAVSGWADLIADTVQRFAVDRLFALNQFPGLTAIPTVAHEAVTQTDLVQLSQYINVLVGAQLITPSEELERYLLSIADLPESTRVAEVWAQREAAAEAKEPPDAAGTAADQVVTQSPALVEGSSMKLDSETLAVLRAATDELRLARQADNLSVMDRPASATPVNVNIENRFDRLADSLEIHNPAPDMRGVERAVTEFGAAQSQAVERMNAEQHDAAERLHALQSDQSERMAGVVEVLMSQPAPIINVQPADVTVNVPAPIVNISVPAQPAPVVNVPPAQVTVSAEVKMPEMDETIDLDRNATGQIVKVRKKTRRSK